MSDNNNTALSVGVVTSDEIFERLKMFAADKDAYAQNTWTETLRTFQKWLAYAEEQGYQGLPANPAHIRAYLLDLQANGRSAATVKVHLSRINMVHSNLGLPRPGVDPVVRRVTKSITRSAVQDGERQGQAVPFRRNDLNTLTELWAESPALMDLRDLALLGIAWNTMLRISEVCRIRVRDIAWQDNETALIHIGWTKTTVNANGIVKALAPRTTRQLRNWMKAADLMDKPDSPLFIPVHHRSRKPIYTDKPLTTRSGQNILNRAWLAVGHTDHTPVKERYASWSGHSARVGACVDLLESGVSLEKIMLLGNWKSPVMVLHYLRNALAGNDELSALIPDNPL